MKRRKYVLAVLMLAGTMALGGCADNKKSGKDNGDKTAKENVVEGEQIKEGELDFKVEDYVTLGEYKGLSVEYPVPEVLEEDVEYAVQELLEENTEYKEIKDRPAKEGDSVNIDYTGVVDGEAFDGGSDSDYDLVLGSGDFLEDFENSLIGKKTGEVVTFPVEFPEEYFDSEMAGKQAEFTVTINKINEVVVPEYTDGLVKEVTAYKTKEEYEDYIRGDLMASSQEESISAAGEEALAQAVENSEVDGYPQGLYDYYYEETVAGYQFYASLMGMEYDEFIAEMGEDSVKEAAEAQVQEYLIAQAIAEKEGLIITDKNYQEEAKALMEQYEIENEYEYGSMEEFEEDYGKTAIITQIVRQKVLDFLYENADVTEVSQDEYYGDGEEVEEETEEGDGEEGSEGEKDPEGEGAE